MRGGSCLEPITIYALQGQWTILVQRSGASDLPLNLRFGFGLGFENTKPVDFLQHMCLSEWDRLHTVVCWWLAPYGARQGHALPAFEWIAVVFIFGNIMEFSHLHSHQIVCTCLRYSAFWPIYCTRLLYIEPVLIRSDIRLIIQDYWNLYVGTKEWH